MYVRHVVKAGQVSFVTLSSDNSVDLAVIASTPTSNVVSIESDELVLTYDSQNGNIEEGVLFTLTDKVTGE